MEMQYMIVKEKNKEALEKEVQSRLNEGWEPQGGVCFDGVGMGGREWCQALVLRKK
ncbi:DUF1737 domain-containing protein [Winogradskyella helgolandensis]|uniref:DUF1737 domain-containing protein n=1 Tax=Winogradskyella helgolandensis TaxID=2697010 RepID=UPI0015B7A121|nr:DUF1737 domain-containing protein [Winogradskyella helgolandensis]